MKVFIFIFINNSHLILEGIANTRNLIRLFFFFYKVSALVKNNIFSIGLHFIRSLPLCVQHLTNITQLSVFIMFFYIAIRRFWKLAHRNFFYNFNKSSRRSICYWISFSVFSTPVCFEIAVLFFPGNVVRFWFRILCKRRKIIKLNHTHWLPGLYREAFVL